MPGTITATSVQTPNDLQRYTLAWTSDGSGNVSGTTFDFAGYLMRVVFDPGGTAPSDNYDVTLVDANGVDILGGTGADRDTANSEQLVLSNPVQVHGTLEPRIANAGSAKTGELVLYFNV